MKYPSIIVLSLLIISCSGGKVSSLPETWETGRYDQLEEAFVQRTEKLMKQSMVKGISLSVVDDQQTVWATGMGLADVKANALADEQTIYRYGSVTKLFTAVAILDLVEQGKIDLNAPIQTYLPEMRINAHTGEADTIRIRHLLTHHSGLTGDRMAGFGFYEPLSADYHQDYLDMPELLSNDFVQFGTDSLFAYCNSAFTLLGVIIQRVTGQDYSDYMQETILNPLGMENSGLIMRPDMQERVAKGYQLFREMDMPYIRDLPAGSLLSSTGEMANFMKMIFNRGVTITGDTLLEATTVEDMFIKKNAHVPLDKNFNIGWTFWLLNPYDHEFLQLPAGHGGDLPPFHAILIMLPGEKLGVTAVTNSNTGANLVIPLAIDLLKAAYEIKTGEVVNMPEKALPAEYSRDSYKHLEGYYPGMLGLSKITAGKKGLDMSMGSLKLALTPHKDGQFSMKLKLFGFIPVEVAALDALGLSFFQHGEETLMEMAMSGISLGVGSRISPVDISQTWQQRAGKYQRVDAFTPFKKNQISYTLDKPRLRMDRSSGFLLLEGVLFGSPIQLPLKPLDDQTAVVMGVGRMGGQTVSIILEEGEEELHWSGMAFRKR